MLGQGREVIAEGVVIGRRAKWLGQWLESGIAMGERIERAHASMQLRIAFFHVSANSARLQHGGASGMK